MNEKELFPDYQPKKTPDTVFDYLKYPKTNIFKILDEIGQPNLEKLKLILSYLKKNSIGKMGIKKQVKQHYGLGTLFMNLPRN